MKRKIRLLAIPATTMVMAAPICTIASCSQHKSVSETAIDEFKKLTVIPHSSDPFLAEVPYEAGNCWNLSCYLRDRISSIIGKNIFQDKYGNLVFDVPANDESLANAPKIALQAHMDMVFSYDQHNIEFKPDPRIWKIALVEDVVDGKKVLHSDKYRTSIGADNGMGVAQILALIQHNEIKHGDLRFILTNCEENGSQGGSLLANETYPELLKDFYYCINLDGEDIGDVCLACSGAIGSYYYFNSDSSKEKLSYVPEKTENNFYKITIDGFPGGHSGVDICKRIDNALQFTNLVLHQINGYEEKTSWHLKLHSISTPGCTVYNAIPKSCEIVLCSDEWKNKTVDDIKTIFQTAFDSVKADRINLDKPIGDQRTYDKQFDAAQYDNVTLNVSEYTPKYKVALSKEDTANLISLQNQTSLEYGIKQWPTDEDMAKLQGDQTSSNIGPAEGKMTSNFTFEYKLSTYSRSSVSQYVADFFRSNEEEAKLHGAKWKYDAKFEPWHVDSNKKLFELCKKGWASAGVEESKVKGSRTHGGLECSFWHELMEKDPAKVGKTAIVSYGPQLHDVHKYTECVELDTVKTCIDTTIYILEHANELTIN